MAKQRSEFLNELEGGTANFTDKEFARLERCMERRGRATASAAAAPREDVPSRSTIIIMLVPSTIPELRGPENLGTILERFRT